MYIQQNKKQLAIGQNKGFTGRSSVGGRKFGLGQQEAVAPAPVATAIVPTVATAPASDDAALPMPILVGGIVAAIAALLYMKR